MKEMQIKKPENKIPAVTWIPVEPELPARTNLKNVSDYLSETHESLPLCQRKLCLSPETRNEIEKAEKLVEDAERQISEMKFNDFFIDDIDLEGFFDHRNMDENIYIRNIVASTLQKGFYDPSISTMFRKGNLKSKLTIASTSPKKTSYLTRILQEQPKIVKELFYSTSHQSNFKYQSNDCLLCKSIKGKYIKPICSGCKDSKILNTLEDITDRKINQDKQDKLNVQKGPVIDIQGEFSIQTSKIVDIQPTKTVQATLDGPVGNIVTYELHHASCRRLNSSNLESDHESSNDISHISEKGKPVIMDNKPNSKNGLRNKFKSQPTELKDNNNTKKIIANKIKENIITAVHLSTINKESIDYSIESEDIDLDLTDFTLSEPLVLTQVDSLLEQQRKIIGRVHNVNEKLDQFLAIKLPSKADFSCRNNENKKQKSSSRNLKNKRDHRINDIQNRKLSSAHDLIESSIEIDDNFNSNKKLVICKYNKEMEITNEAEDIVNNVSADSKDTSKSRTTTNNSMVSRKKSFAQELQNRACLSSFTIISQSSKGSTSVAELAKEQSKIVDKILSSNDSSGNSKSIHSGTKSNISFVENFTNSQHFQNNNEIKNIDLGNKEKANKSLRSNADEERKYKDVVLNEEHTVNNFERVLPIKESMLTMTDVAEQYVDDRHKMKNGRLHSQSIIERNREKKEIDKETSYEQNELEYKKEISENFQDQLDDSSQKTLHLIESISEVSFNKKEKDSLDSMQLSFLLKDKEFNELSKMDANPIDDARDEKSSVLKIESKILEARHNLNNLMKHVNDDKKVNSTDVVSNEKSTKTFDKIESSSEEKAKLKNNTYCKIVLDSKPNEKSVTEHYIPTINNRHNLSNTKSYITMLEENNTVVQESFQQHKLSLLKKLDSCSIPLHYESQQLFSSTVLTDMEHLNNFARSHVFQSESSTETHSEGEVCFSSSASYSLGEIRRKLESSNSSSQTKDSSTNIANPNISLYQPNGEINKI